MRRVVGPSGRAPTMLISCFPSVETAEADMPPQDRDENCDVDQGSVPTGLQSMDSGKDSAHHWPDGATRSSGSLASVVSLTIVPCALTAQIAVLASETSNPIYTSMSLSCSCSWRRWGRQWPHATGRLAPDLSQTPNGSLFHKASALPVTR